MNESALIRKHRFLFAATFCFLFLGLKLTCFGQHGNTQIDSSSNTFKNTKNYSRYSHAFFSSVGYNYCRTNFLDLGLRYYHWVNDGQTSFAFAGASAGCEFSLKQADKTYIPYLGWQGHWFGLGYGLRAEYIIGREKQVLGMTPELGFSLFEILRITGAYRLRFDKNDAFAFSNLRFSLIASFPTFSFKGH